MKCLILAAGYATRLYPLTENFPKPLLKVGDKTILDWLVDDIDTAGLVDTYVVISNHKFAHHFEDWAATKKQNIRVVDDGTISNETRLGAVCDVQFAIDQLGLDDDLLVIAGDNVLDFSLSRFVAYADEKKTSCIMRYYEPSEKKLTKCGVVELDDQDRILSMEEKPAQPKSHWCCPPFYVYTREDAQKVKDAIAQKKCGTDAPGSFIAWLCTVTDVHAMEMPGKRYDIGNLESYQQVQQEYQGIKAYDNRDDVAYALTDFGKLFRDLCLMTPTDIEQDEFVFQDEQNNAYISGKYAFSDTFGTVRKSEKNGHLYIRHKFSIEDVDNGSQIAVVFRVYNNYSEEKSLERVYLESQRGKIYAAENKMPVTIKPKKFFDCIFAIKSKQMLEELESGNGKYVIQEGKMIYEMSVTEATRREIAVYLKYFKEDN